MVYLNRIYTRSGDLGETSLGNGERVAKTSARIVAIGAVDELNAAIGVLLALGNPANPEQTRLLAVQNALFDLGADLCVPEEPTLASETATSSALRITQKQVTQLEDWIDQATSLLEPLKSFILPGGQPLAALLHSARTVCRRAEINLLQLHETEQVNLLAIAYLNRLSDWLFVLARMANDQGRSDILWKPGQS